MISVKDVYSISIKDHRRAAKKRMDETGKTYNCLKNKDSLYAKGIKKLHELHTEMFMLYKNAPESMDSIEI